MSSNWQINQRVDLAQGPASVAVWPKALMVVGDGNAHEWRVEVLENGKPAELKGTVNGYFIRVDGVTIPLEGSLQGNVASVVLDSTCYAYEGDLRGILRVTDGKSVVTLSALLFRVTHGTTDEIVDPGIIIPSLDSLLQQLENMKEAAENADTAADRVDASIESATSAAQRAEASADAADAAADKATNALVGMEEATTAATQAAEAANTSAGNADTATERANTAASGVEAATQRANDAADRVDDSIQAATEAADAANKAADAANTATADAESATESANAAADAANSATGDASQAAQEASSAANAANEAADRANQAAAGLGITKKIVDVLPPADEMADDVIYLVPSQVSGESNVYEEYMKIEGKAEMIGSTATDLTDYVKFEDIPDHLITGEADGDIQTLYNQTTSEPISPRTVVEALSGTGTEGQLVGYTEDNVVGNITPDAAPIEGSTNPVQSSGVYEATKWCTNKNLLDNWYFVGGGSQHGRGQFPINQRGQTEYTGADIKYSIDRWCVKTNRQNLGPLVINDGYVTVSGFMYQRHVIKNMTGMTVTLSMLTDEDLYIVPSIAITGIGTFKQTSKIGQFDLYVNTDAGFLNFGVNVYGGSVNVIAMKLELGDKQTLAHKDGDTWVLNEIPDYEMELAKCQRYQLNLLHPAETVNEIQLGNGIAWSINCIGITIPTPVTLRAKPTIETSINQFAVSGIVDGATINNSHNISSVSVFNVNGNNVEIRIIFTDSFLTEGGIYRLRVNGAINLILNANL